MEPLSVSSIELIEKELPTVSKKDVANLIDVIDTVSSLKTAPDSLDNWSPTPLAVKELVALQVRLVDIPFCLSDFISYAKQKGWSVSDNLDAKLITHIKIMIQNRKITTVESAELVS